MTQTTDSIKLARAAAARPPGLPASAGLRSHAAEPLPAQAGSWRLEGLLGEGTLARVFAARPVGSPTDRAAPYALKMLRPRWNDRPEALSLLRREASIGRSVAHPHLVAILAAHVHEPPYFVVMPRLAGQTLSTLLRRTPILSVSRALWIARQTAEALDALHRHGLLHGDVKPANLQLAPTGHATLLDLSFARPMNDGSSLVDLPLLGTLNYLPPEQIASTLRCDHRSDIYSLGIVLYEMLAGRPPFEAADLAELLHIHRQQRPKHLRTLRPDVPSPLANLVRQMVSKEPLRRPQTMDEVIRTLVRLEIAEGAAINFGSEPAE
jgi:serine/threonine protein kinase